MNDSQKFNKILKRYYDNTCSNQEKVIVEKYFEKMQLEGADLSNIKNNAFLKQKIYDRIDGDINKKSRFTFIAKIAAAVLLLVASSVLVTNIISSKNKITYLTAQAYHGKQMRLVLSDSSVVYLNSGSSLSYPNSFENLDERNVTLEGQGYFEITKDKTKPFTVISNKIKTRVLGTKFEIDNFNKDYPSVTVTEGKVNVSDVLDHTNSVNVTPEQRVVFNTYKNSFSKSKVNTSDYVDWIHGKVLFNNADLIEIASKIERRFAVEVDVNIENVPDCLITGKYSGDNINELLKSIRFVNGIEYKVKNNTLTLTGINCK